MRTNYVHENGTWKSNIQLGTLPSCFLTKKCVTLELFYVQPGNLNTRPSEKGGIAAKIAAKVDIRVPPVEQN